MTAQRAVFVTGASGYVGRLCIDALTRRWQDLAALVALDLAPVNHADRIPGVTYIDGDICDPALPELLREHAIDTVVHLASIVRRPSGAPKNIAYRVDVLGARNVLNASLAAGVKRLIVTSSGAAYGYHKDNPAWIEEDAPLRGNEQFEYARNKRLVEEMLAQWRRDNP